MTTNRPTTLLRRRLRPVITGTLAALCLVPAFAFFGGWTAPAHAEYGDVVINNYSDAAGIRPVVFPHWFHRIRFTCKVCHADLGFKLKAGANDINMAKIIEGQFCGSCHNGEISWSIENCDLCHSGRPGLPTHVHGGSRPKPVAPAGTAAPAPN